MAVLTINLSDGMVKSLQELIKDRSLDTTLEEFVAAFLESQSDSEWERWADLTPVRFTPSGKTLSNPFELAKQDTAQAPKKREWAGFKARVRFLSQELTGDIEVRYGKVDVEPLLDVDGNLEKVGPQGLPVTSRWEKRFYEGGQEITEDQIRHLQTLEDGSKQEVGELDKTNVFEIQEGRAIEECTLDEDGRKALGTTITREDVSKYAPDSVYAIWADDSSWGLLRLAEYLEKQKIALFFPFTHGRGFKTYTCTVYPIRFNGDLYILMVMNSGEMILKKPIRRAEGVVKEEKRVVLLAPRLRAKKAAGVQ